MSRLEELQQQKASHECKVLGGTCMECEYLNEAIYTEERTIDAQAKEVTDMIYHNHNR